MTGAPSWPPLFDRTSPAGSKSGSDWWKGCGPLPACPAGEAVGRLERLVHLVFDPCRLVRQVKQLGGSLISSGGQESWRKPPNCFTCRTSRQGSKEDARIPTLSRRTASPAGQAGRGRTPGERAFLALELLHLPDKPAGVRIHSTNRETRFRRLFQSPERERRVGSTRRSRSGL